MIFKPIKIGNKNLKNRIILSPMCQYMSDQNGSPSEWHYQHLGRAMISGFGMVMLESTAINHEGRITKKDLVLSNIDHMTKFKNLLNYLKKLNDTPVGIQISHAGRKGSSEIPWIKHNSSLGKKDGWQTISASSIPRDKSWPKPKEIPIKEIKNLINDFKKTARLAIDSGFDCIEIHMAHGYLLHQFFSPISNKRIDKYGGNIVNRSRFLLEIAKELKNICKKKIILGARVTGNDWVRGGLNENDCIYLVKKLQKIGIDYVCITSGGIFPRTNLKEKKCYNSFLSKKIKKNVKIPIRVAGLINNLKDASLVLNNKRADLIAIGRTYLKNPNFLLEYFSSLKKYKIIPKSYLRGFIK